MALGTRTQTALAQVASNLLALGVRGVSRKTELLYDAAGRGEVLRHHPERAALPTRHAMQRERRNSVSHTLQTPPTHALRLCIIKPTGFSRPFREYYHCFLRY